MPPRDRDRKPKAQQPHPARHPRAGTVEPGDHVYAHSEHGPLAMKVLACGRDGFTGECAEGRRHSIPYGRMLGHKSRVKLAMKVIDAGQEGAIVEDDRGRRHYLAGDLAPAPAGTAAEASETPVQKDPLTDGLDRLAKALDSGAPILLLKAGPIQNAPGLTLRDVTDRRGHQTKRWVRTMKDQPQPRRPAAADPRDAGQPRPAIEHGEEIAFRHGEVRGRGTVVASGRDGVTVRDAQGQTHQVRHDAIEAPEPKDGQDAGERAEGGAAPAGKPDQAAPAAGGQDAEAIARSLTTEDDARLPKEAPQPVNTQEELYERAKPALDELATWLDKDKGVSTAMGHRLMNKSPDDVTPEEWASDEGMLFIAPLKGAARATEKVMAEYGGNWNQLRDVVRCSIAVPTMADVAQVMEKLRASGMTLAQQPKNRFAKPIPVGYRDLLMNVRLPSGLIAEVQVHAKPMIAAKNEGHHWYEVTRGIEAKCLLDGGRDPTEDEAKKIAEAEAKQKAIYGRAWARLTGAKEEAEMTKALRLGRRGARPKPAAGGGEFEYFAHDGGHYRRPKGSALRSVREVLHGTEWKPYKGRDALAPAFYGEQVDDPLAKAATTGDGEDAAPAGQDQGEGKRQPMMKALVRRLIFWRA